MRTSRRLVFLALTAALLVAAALIFTLLRVRSTLRRATLQARAESQLPFTLRPLSPSALRAQSAGFEPIAASVRFTAGAELDGDLYLTGPAGLFVMGADGTLRQSLRTGVDLPAAALGMVQVGQPRGAPGAQVLLATAGAGLLMLTPGKQPTLQQMLPADVAERDLTAVLATAAGDVLLGTRDHGLLLFNGSQLTRATGLPGDLQVTALGSASAGYVVGTRNAGAYLVHGGQIDHLDTSSGLPDEQVDAIAVSGGHAYLGTPRGVAEVSLERTPTVRVLAQGVFAHSLLASSTELTIGTLDEGIQQISLVGRPHLRLAGYAAGTSRVDDLFAGGAGGSGQAYAVSDGVVLRRRGAGWTEALSLPVSALTDGNISALAFTPEGTLYVGYFDRGLDLLNSDLTLQRHLEDDHLFCLNRLVLDPVRKTMAAATANGLVLFDATGRPRQTLSRRDGLISDHVNDLAFTAQGLTVATPAGLTFLTATGTSSLYAFQGLVNNHVYALAPSKDPSQLLAGTLGGLSVLTADEVTRNFTVANSGLKHNWITALAASPEGGWVVGTYGAGVERLSAHGVFTPQDMPRDLVINPNALLVTASAIYAGTLGRGLLVFENGTGRWSLVTQGLPSENVTAFAARGGVLYVGTESGLVQIAESSLSTFLGGGAR